MLTTLRGCGAQWRDFTDETSLHAADDFAVFFKDKVDAVRASTATTPAYEVPFKATMSTLEDEVKLIASALNKTRQLDIAPTWLEKEMRGSFPAEFKQAIVRLLLKKSDASDASEMKSYRPVSNLSFISKLSEKLV